MEIDLIDLIDSRVERRMPKNARAQSGGGHVHPGGTVGGQFVYSAREIRDGPASVVFGGGISTAGDIVMSPGGFQRVEVLTRPRVGQTVAYNPACTLTSNITISATSLAYTSTGDPITAGDTILVDSEAMYVQAVFPATNTVTVIRGGMQGLQTSPSAHTAGAPINRVSVQSVLHVTGGIRATGGIATSDLALQGDSTQEILVKRTFTNPVPTWAGTPDGDMALHFGEHSHTTDTNYRVEIETTGATGYATFRWSADGGGSWLATGVATSQGITHLQSGVYISFVYGVHFATDRWDFTAVGTVNQVELIRADTKSDTLYLRAVNLSAVTSVHRNLWAGELTYTGTLSTVYGFTATVINQTSAASPGVYGGIITTELASVGDNATGMGISTQIQVLSSQTGTISSLTGILIVAPFYSALAPAAGTVYGLHIEDHGNPYATIGTLAALRIDSQTAGATATYNIWQRGTTGVNRLAAPTRIGSDASPDTNMELQVDGMTVIGECGPFANDAGYALKVGLPSGPDAAAIIAAHVYRTAAAAEAPYGFLFTGAYDLNGQSGGGWTGVSSVMSIDNTGAAMTLGGYYAFQAGMVISSSTNLLTLTEGVYYDALSPSFVNVTATYLAGLRIQDLGGGGGTITTGVAVDIAAMTTVTDRYSLRVAGTARTVHLPNIAIGGGHALTVVPGATVDIDPINVTGVSTEQIGLLFQNRTIALSSGATVATMRHVQFFAPTINGIAGGGAETVTDAATVYISDAPSGSNITLTRSAALWVAAGRTRLGGELKHEGTTLSFYNVAAVTRPTAYTQTYATADKTHANFTSADLAAFTGGLVGFLDAAERDNLRTQFNALRADVADVKQLTNSVIDDLQTLGVLQ